MVDKQRHLEPPMVDLQMQWGFRCPCLVLSTMAPCSNNKSRNANSEKSSSLRKNHQMAMKPGQPGHNLTENRHRLTDTFPSMISYAPIVVPRSEPPFPSPS